ncbi:MAG: peptidase M64 [Candidatus Aminicenantes bacterium]|nr:peptidase M64 [Candidatus Aminicenantes bacterium]
MKRIPAAALFLLSVGLLFQAETTDSYFSRHFRDLTLRIDYYHTGNRETDTITLDRMYKEGIWAGPVHFLRDEFNNGQYYVKVFAADSNELLYSRGFNSYFYEYRTTEPAIQGLKRTFHESVRFPFPRRPVRMVLQNRDRKLQLQTVFTLEIDPGKDYFDTAPPAGAVQIVNLLLSGHPRHCVDLALVAEGYRPEDRKKLERDFARAREVLFSREPFASNRDRFNLYGVFAPSRDSGCDEPRQKTYRDTAVESSFNALDLARYLLVENNPRLQNILSRVPFDAVIVMVNHERYGGGGIYNQYCVFTADSQAGAYLLLHEFGHSFAGLADEYYSSRVSYNEFVPPGVEPMEPNVTALLDPAKLKWKQLVKPGTPIPTPWEKKHFDKLSAAEQARHLKRDEFRGLVGAFEGAMYASEGMYRPTIDCIMFSRNTLDYCPVCRNAVERVIRHYCGIEP